MSKTKEGTDVLALDYQDGARGPGFTAKETAFEGSLLVVRRINFLPGVSRDLMRELARAVACRGLDVTDDGEGWGGDLACLDRPNGVVTLKRDGYELVIARWTSLESRMVGRGYLDLMTSHGELAGVNPEEAHDIKVVFPPPPPIC